MCGTSVSMSIVWMELQLHGHTSEYNALRKLDKVVVVAIISMISFQHRFYSLSEQIQMYFKHM